MDAGIREVVCDHESQKKKRAWHGVVVFMQSQKFIGLFLLVVLLTHIPTGTGTLLGDDYTQWAASTTPQVLAEKGFHIADPENSFIERIQNMFLFMSADTTATEELKNYGSIPWWSPDNITMHMFRPIAAITHWADYQFLNKNVFLMQLHTVFYLLLLAASYFAFCRLFNAPGWVPALAVAFFVYSYSMSVNLNWLAARNAVIAPMFALWAVMFHHQWRHRDNVIYLALSLVALLLALLSAEAGVATLAYLGAYAVLLDRRRSLLNAWTILPALAVVVGWRLVYSANGFGAENIDLYVDPVRSPLEFLTERVPMLPIYYAKVIFGPLFNGFLLFTSSVPVLSLISLVICLLALWPVYPYLKRDRLMQFGLLASVVAVIPFLSTNPGSRSAPFLHLGFLLMMSIWVYNVAQNHRVSKGIKALAVAILVYHLVIPGVLTTARHLRLITIDVKGVDAYSSVAEDLADGETNLVIVNSPDFFNYYHRPFGWTYHNKPLPKKIQMLAPGLTALTIKRESETTYRLFSEEGFAMLANTPRNVDQKEDPHFNRKEVLGFRANNQIMTNNETVFRIGQQVEANGFSATVLDIKDDVPSEIRIVFEQQKPAVWQWYDWSERSFKRMDQLAVGESRFIQGPFDPS